MSSNKRRKAIFLDIDGTLIYGGKGPFKDDIEAMEKAAAAGHLLFLNTGRSFGNIPEVMSQFSFFSGIVAGGGAHVSLSDDKSGGFNTIYHQWVPEEMLAKIFDYYGKRSLFCMLEAEGGCYTINSFSRLHTARAPILVNSLEEYKNKSDGDLISKLTLDRFASEEECSFLEPFFRMNRFIDYSEGIIRTENKGKGMDLVLNTLGIEREDSIAIGDSINDLEMIQTSGLGIAMGNAFDELKEAAGAITEDCGKGGVAAAIKNYVL